MPEHANVAHDQPREEEALTEPHAADDIEGMLSRIKELQQDAQNGDCSRIYYTPQDFVPGHVLFIPLIAIIEYSAIMKRQPFGPLEGKGQYLQHVDDIHSGAEYVLSCIKECQQEYSDYNIQLFDEFLTPLNAIIGFSEMIKLEYLGPLGNHRYIEYTENIYASGRELWEDFLDMIEIARIKKGKRELNAEIVDVQQVLQDILQQSEQKTVKITWKPSVVRLPNIYLDPHLLRTMLSNIIHGAVMSNSSSDTVLISTELSDGLTFVAEAPFIRSPSYLGFTLTKVIAEWHGGHFSVDTTPNVGITVRLSFPPERVMIRRATITR